MKSNKKFCAFFGILGHFWNYTPCNIVAWQARGHWFESSMPHPTNKGFSSNWKPFFFVWVQIWCKQYDWDLLSSFNSIRFFSFPLKTKVGM